MSYPEYPQYKIRAEWVIDGKWFACYLVQMFQTERRITDITADLRENWWAEFAKKIDGPSPKGPYITVLFNGEDTWCVSDGFYWTFDSGCGDEELLASWEDYRDRWGVQDDVEFHRCEFCESLGIVRMEVVRSGKFDDPA